MKGEPSSVTEFDLTACDREPIHIPGAIQPHGVLLAVDPASLKIAQIAGDTQALLGMPSAALLGQGIEAKLGHAVLVRMQSLLGEPSVLPRPLFVFKMQIGDVALDATASTSGGLLVLELERASAGSDAIGLVQSMTSSLQTANDEPALLRTLAAQVQSVTGFDRVMVYRFRPDDSGHVVAESRAHEGVESFLDLHYPASDIPAQARLLYRTNWIRFIPDVGYTPAPLAPALNPLTNAPLDLSKSSLRSVSPLHLEYLRNMGVAASMSLSLVVHGQLWGLIACHHETPRTLTCGIRIACELFAQVASLKLQTVLEADQALARLRARDVHDALVQAMSRGKIAEALLHRHPHLLDLVPAAGVAVQVDGEITVSGRTPDLPALEALTAWLSTQHLSGVFATDCLSEAYPPAARFTATAAGLLALSISREPRDYVLWFLPEQTQTVTWAGNPEKPVIAGPHGSRLSPRTSFAAWRELVSGRSRPWGSVELEAAHLMRVALLEIVLSRLDELTRERRQAQSQQDLLMAELDHRVKNTLATIQALVRFSGRAATDTASFVEAVEQRLQSMAKTHNILTGQRWEGAAIEALVVAELGPHRPAGEAAISLQGGNFEVTPKIALSLSLALHELATNAAKYGALSVPEGKLSVHWQQAAREGRDGVTIHWRESGGPAVQKPTRRGFGRTLLERIFAGEVNGTISLDFAPEGLVCEIFIPASTSAGPAILPAAPATPPQATGIAGTRVLLVEDSVLIALDLADFLEGEGAVITAICHSLEQGLAQAENGDFDIAVLDVDLNGALVWPLAEIICNRLCKPIVLSTGFSEILVRPGGLEHIPSVTKPYDRARLLEAVATLVRR